MPLSYNVNFTFPIQPQTFSIGETIRLSWTSLKGSFNYKVEFYNGTSWSTLTASTSLTYYDFDTTGQSAGSGRKFKVSIVSRPASDESAEIELINSSIGVIYPNGGESLQKTSKNHLITWSKTNDIDTVNIELWKGGVKDSDIATSVKGKIYSWNTSVTSATDYKVKIISGSVSDESDANFSIVDEKSITVTTPNGGEKLINTNEITWTNTGTIANYKIELYKNDILDRVIVESTASSPYEWTIPSDMTGGDDYKVKIIDATDSEVYDFSDAEFTIRDTSTLYIAIRNDEGSTISAGTPLYSKGEIGGANRILVGVADADDSAKMPCIGIAYEEMNTTSTKDNFAITSGIYNTNISGFTGLAVGDILYVSDSGGLTQTRPSNTDDLIQNVGIVLRTNGTICQGLLVSAIGRTNDVPNLLTNTLHLDDDVKLEFGDADEYIKGDGSQLIISSSNQIDFNNSRFYDVNRITFNDLTTQTTAPVNKWSIQTGGYKTNNNSDTTYYFQYRPNGESWANADSSIASIGIYDTYASMLVAPYDGKVTKISVHGYANDTGATDPFKFYVFKGTPLSGGGSMTLTQIGVTGTITPPASLRQFVENTDISSSNTFSENDAIFVMYKKDSTTANQDLYFSVTVSGEYT